MSDEQLRRALLERAPNPGDLKDYRRKVEAMIQDKEKWLRRGTVGNMIGYVSALLTAIVLMIGAGVWYDGQLKQVWLGVTACFLMMFAVGVQVNHLINWSRLHTEKDLKAIEMRLIEIQQRLDKA
ncbi:MAG: hypothetical protein ACM3NQ_03885 [Bacteroidales bacterium]